MKKYRVLFGSISIIYEDWIPYASGVLISALKKDPHLENRLFFHTPLFRFQEFDEITPILIETDFLCLTNYIWNQKYNDELTIKYKQLNPTGIVLYGGSNIPVGKEEQRDYVQKRSYVDHFFTGQAEGSICQYFRQYLSNTSRIERIIEPASNEPSLSPTPYTDGVFDEILENVNSIKASFETNRGCPYSCTFCDWGGTSMQKLKRFPLQEVKDTIKYLYSQKSITEIEILDANLGILERDVEIVNYMREMSAYFSRSPNVSYSGLAKNGSKNLKPILKTVSRDLGSEQRNIKISLQTFTDEALKLSKRDNIKDERLIEIAQDVARDEVDLTAEFIIGLPGDSPEGLASSLQKCHDLRVKWVRAYPLIVLNNTEIQQRKFQIKNDIKTKLVYFPYELRSRLYESYSQEQGPILNNHCQEEFQVISSCISYSEEDLVLMYDYWWVFHNLYNSNLVPLSMPFIKTARSILQNQRKFPFFLSLLQKQRKIIKDLFSQQTSSLITDIESYLFFLGAMRTDELYNFLRNQEALKNELIVLSEMLEVDHKTRALLIDRCLNMTDHEPYGIDGRVYNSTSF